MENEKINITVAEGCNEVIVRHGEAEKVTDPHVYNGYSVDGSIGNPVEFLNKDVVDAELIQNSYLIYSYDKFHIVLFYAQHMRESENIGGNIQLSKEVEKFNINTGAQYTTEQLGEFIKMNRHYFPSKTDAMALVTELKNFKGKVNKIVESANDDRGSVKKVFQHEVIDNNIPAGFTLSIPVFKGMEKVSFQVEININQNFECTLISPDLQEIIETQSRELIDEQLTEIRKLYPQLRCFQV